MQAHRYLLTAISLLLSGVVAAAAPVQAPKTQPPNILFVIMDDVGIDQFQQAFGYGNQATWPSRSPTPMMDTLARSGVRFTNAWSMPECSPSRALLFTGRYPLRTHVYAPLLPLDLANSQVSPYEMTTPKVLNRAGYQSALFGKLHIGGEHHYPNGDQSLSLLGFDYFHGPMGGTTAGAMPDPIDTTAGGVAPAGTYECGFIPNADHANGADRGACYFADSRQCETISRTSAALHPGRACLEQGGIFVPDDTCQKSPPPELDFDRTNAYYVWSFAETDAAGVINKIPRTDRRSRTYWPTEITEAAIGWIKAQKNGPWMATVSYPSIHAPYQQAPQALTPNYGDLGAVSCTQQIQTLSGQMLQAMDTEVGRLLVETGLASMKDGRLQYRPEASNTMIIIIGDNGTYGPAVRPPFDPNRSKGTVAQTGVWVPLMVAGPLVKSPDRAVDSMVNLADLFELFGEIAGLDVRKIVPSSRVLDSVSMLPYLTHPAHPSLRRYNFTQTGINFTANGQRPEPCVVPMSLFGAEGGTCLQLMTDKETCEGEAGRWYGDRYSSCCELLKNEPDLDLEMRWLSQEAVRNEGFKLVQAKFDDCSRPNATVTRYGFYEIDHAAMPKLESPQTNLIANQELPEQGLTPEQARNYKLLRRELDRIMASEVACPGDGNGDGIVDQVDLDNWDFFRMVSDSSSWYDFLRPNSEGIYVYDGVTDHDDLGVILQNLGKCPQR